MKPTIRNLIATLKGQVQALLEERAEWKRENESLRQELNKAKSAGSASPSAVELSCPPCTGAADGAAQ